MAWVKVANRSDFEEGQGMRVCHGGRVVAVFLAEGALYGVDDRCSHAEASLSEGEVFDTEVECPLHGAAFDLATGEALTLPATRPVATYRTREEEGAVFVEIAEGVGEGT
jgi:3-phenylpropionate/trans-cinnamate dioxygenase ferredoxin subunit